MNKKLFQLQNTLRVKFDNIKLQEYSLKKYKELPKYKLFKQTGPNHKPVFKVEVTIPNSKKFSANGTSKKNAEQNAAKKLITELKI